MLSKLTVAGLALACTGAILLDLGPEAPVLAKPVARLQPVAQQQGRLRGGKPPKAVDSIRITPVVRAVQKAGPSILNIQVGDIVADRRGRVFRKLGEGSGVIVSEDGLVLTNWHVVRFKERLGESFVCRVKLRDGTAYAARVINTSRENDLALLLITPQDGIKHRFPPVEMGDSETLMIGETVIAIGNPRGQVNSVTTGVLSGVGRSLSVRPQGERRAIQFETLLQHDAAINPGNSGGGLLDLTGKLIGINTLMQAQSQNINFAIPVNHVRKIFERDLLNAAQLALWFGFETRVTPDGLQVASVVRESPADKAGFRKGDRIAQVGERPVKDSKTYATALVTQRSGERVPFLLERGGAQEWTYVEAWSRSQGEILERTGCSLVLVDASRERDLYRKVRADLYEYYDYRGPNPVLIRVAAVERRSPADKFGMRAGDLIIGTIIRRRGYGTYFPLVGGVREFASRLRTTRDGFTPELSVWRVKDGLLTGRMTMRQR